MADKYINLSAGLSALRDWVKGKLTQKQDALVSGTNIKTVDGVSILGAGNIDTSDAFVATYGVTTYADLTAAIAADKVILLAMTANNNLFCMTYSTYTNGGNAIMYAIFNYEGRPSLLTATLTPGGNWSVTNENLQGDGATVEVPGTTISDMMAVASNGDGTQTFWIMPDFYYDGGGDRSDWVRLGFSNPDLNYQEATVPSAETFNEVTSGLNDRIAAKTAQATDDTLGTVKTNSEQAITLNANGQLQVGGRMGQFPTTTGIYAPNNRAPRAVGEYSFLMTDALGVDMAANRAMAIVSGYGMTCQSAAAGATEYRVTNNYANRIICKMAEGGYAALNESESTQKQIVRITSVTINGAAFTPDSAADSSTPIVIKTASTLNPDAATTSIRLFGKMGSYATAHFGNGVASDAGGRCLLVGGGIRKSGSANDNLLVGNGIFSSGNGVAAFGRYHIARKNRGLLAGTGHDTTNAPSEGASAVGQYSYMDANTLFAVGNGSSHTNRSNALEVRTDGIVIKSPNGTRFKIAVDDSGNLSATQL